METFDRVLDKQIDQSYLNRYQEKDNADDIVYELDEIITQLDNLRDSNNMDVINGYSYCHICDAIELLREAKENLESEGY